MKYSSLFLSSIFSIITFSAPPTVHAEEVSQIYKVRVHCSGAEGVADGVATIAVPRGSYNLYYNGMVAQLSRTATPVGMYLSARDGVVGYEVELAEIYMQRDGGVDGMNVSRVLFSHENGLSLGRYDARHGDLDCSIKVSKTR